MNTLNTNNYNYNNKRLSKIKNKNKNDNSYKGNIINKKNIIKNKIFIYLKKINLNKIRYYKI